LERHQYLISSTEWGTGTVKKGVKILIESFVPKSQKLHPSKKEITIPTLNSKSSKKASKTHPYETERQSIRIFIHNCVFSFKFPQNFYFIISFCDTIFTWLFTSLFSFLIYFNITFYCKFLFAFPRELCDKKNYFTCFALDFYFQWSRRSSNFLVLTFERLKIEISNLQQNFTKKSSKNSKSPLKVPANFTQNSNIKNTFYRFKIN
jgi:hypothetical protein